MQLERRYGVEHGWVASIERLAVGSSTKEERHDLADEAAPALPLTRSEALRGQAARNFDVLRSDTAEYGATLGCKACSFVSQIKCATQ